MKNFIFPFLILMLIIQSCGFSGTEFHVSPSGNDSNKGTRETPLQSISAAAALAQAGDIITVHEGVYRERINPPRGGSSDNSRIVYQAAPGEKVVIKGSEVIKNWQHIQEDTWKVIIPNSLFGDFNPFSDDIHGDWFYPLGRPHHTGAVYLNGHWLTEAVLKDSVLISEGTIPKWFATVDSLKDGNTTIWAQFKAVDPNKEEVEINVRQTVFYPEITGINYLTVKGFIMEQAATPWAPPTAEQIGLIGTHWSKGWIIEQNTIRYSTCVGITLGKHGDQWDNTSADAAVGYVKTIERGTEAGWTKENIGHHHVRNNNISHCEQAGIVGSLGAIFSSVVGNTIHDIHVRLLFSGAEMAGIKFHGAIDSDIQSNHIFRCNRGIWLDWMTQGTRVTQNLLHDNGPSEDLFLEVNHGPALIDNNLLLSKQSLLVNSQGAAYVHNLIAGRIHVVTGERRKTPHLVQHSTTVAGLAPNKSGDERFFNNLLVGTADLGEYDKVILPVWMNGNVFLHGAKAGKAEDNPLIVSDFNPEIRIIEKSDGWFLELSTDENWTSSHKRKLITSEMLGTVEVPGLPFLQPDDKPYLINKDYLGQKRDSEYPAAGPFANTKGGKHMIKVWPQN